MAEDLTVTGLLHEASRGDREALDRLVPRVYETLRGLAHRELRRERPGHTLSATALAHEAYIKLIGLERIEWRDRSHFFAMAARSMRRILVDYAVSRKAQKRGGGAVPVSLMNDDMPALANESRLEELLAVDEALTRLEAAAPVVVRIVECRVFAGMTIDETAAVLELSPATVKRHWTTARAWLNRELSAEARSDG
jgi:RNA polymerase sigma factor (TIGR02999 family)